MADTTSRFAVYVPDPKTRLNLGKPEEGDSEFGYKGASLQASENLFIDISKNTLMQTGKAVYVTSGGSWTQAATKDMTVVTRANSMWAASGKVLLAAGAGMSQSKVSTSGDQPAGSPYNSLSLHYKVEAVQNTLKKLFFGDKWFGLQLTPQPVQTKWVLTGKYPDDGLLGQISKLLEELGYPATKNIELRRQLLQQLEWSGDNLTSNMVPISVFGPFNTFDPYATTSFDTKKPWTVGLAVLLQMGVFLKRTADTLEALVVAITNNEVIKRIKHLSAAVKAFTGLVAKVNPSKWEKYGGDVWTSAKDKWDKKRTDWKGFSNDTTTAELLGAAEMYDVSTLTDKSLKMNDTKGGVDISLDLSPFANEQPAVHIITMGSDFAAISVSTTANGTLTLSGTTMTWDHQNSKWVDGSGADMDLPDGFVEDGGVIKMDGGGLFTAEAADGVTITDTTFTGEKLAVEVDGATHTVATDGINGLTATDRAARAASVIGGVAGVTATASGSQVTMETTNKGSDASIAIAAKTGEHVTLGLGGNASGTDGGEMSAGQLARLINGSTTKAKATVVNGAVRVVHNVEGDTSYLKFHGEAAVTTFGTNPTEDQGTSPSFFDQVGEFEAIVGYLEGWPSTLGVWVAPVVSAVRQVAGVWGQITTAAKKLKAVFLGAGLKEGIGMIAGDAGFTVGTSGGIYNVGKTITLVAAGDSAGVPIDPTRFNPLFEPIIFGIKKVEGAAKKWINSKLDPPADPKKQSLSGFRVISSGDAQTIARRHIRFVSKESFEVFSQSTHIVSRGRVSVSSRVAGVTIEGTHVQIGSEKGGTEQRPTKSVSLEANESFIRFTTKSLGGWMHEVKKQVFFGTKKAGMVPQPDMSKAHILIDDAKVAIGSVEGANRRGVIVESGDVTIDAANTVTIGAGGKTGVEVGSSGVTVSGKFEVGSALTVNGVPLPLAPLVEITSPDPDIAKVAALKTKYAAVVALATGLKLAILGLDQSIMIAEQMKISGGPLLGPVGLRNATKALARLKKTRHKQMEALQEARGEWDTIIVAARGFSATDILTKTEDDRETFEVDAP